MKGPRELLENEDHLVTRMGAWFPGERTVFRGKDLHRDFGDADWMALYVYAITGRRFSGVQLELMNTMWVFTSYPDPRLWNNRVAALAGSARSTGALALSAALAVSEATVYGRRPDIRTLNFLQRIKSGLDRGESLPKLVQAELARYRALPGYGRPVVRSDERLDHLMRRAEALGLNRGPYVTLAFDIGRYLRASRRRLQMNYAVLTAAFCADFGFTAREFYLFAFGAFLAGMIPCWIEAAERPEGTFLPLSCRRIAFDGPGRRRWDDGPVGGTHAATGPLGTVSTDAS
ncbi:MAG: citrate synthase family protein [Gammaproteobacteria bacterium]|nr:citrate/2-methylcitrate synthase [Gammaproteobacteria bacterium]